MKQALSLITVILTLGMGYLSFADEPEQQACLTIEDISKLQDGSQCQTTEGLVLERVSDPVRGWMEVDKKDEKGVVTEKRGMVWPDRIEEGTFTFDEALVKYGNGKNVKNEKDKIDKNKFIPSADPDFRRLRAGFKLEGGVFTPDGKKEFSKLFPKMYGHWFWSSSSSPYDVSIAYGFNGLDGGMGYGARNAGGGSVVCVGLRR